ncbi:MAG: hypothetical protein ACP5PS_04500 [Bacteroidales bacterium]
MMFSFGLFATHTPYLILAALYMCYMGSWLISSLFPQLTVEASSQSQQTIVIEQVVHTWVEAGTVTSNNTHPYAVKHLTIRTTEIYVPPIFEVVGHICLSPVLGPRGIYIGQLYNRPPPHRS